MKHRALICVAVVTSMVSGTAFAGKSREDRGEDAVANKRLESAAEEVPGTAATTAPGTTTGTTEAATDKASPPPFVHRASAPSVRVSGHDGYSLLESHGQIPRFDIGGSFGYNNSAGVVGIETEYRLMEYLGVGLHGGIGLWGIRLSPVVHAYPFGASNLGLYGELAASLNLGGAAHLQVGTDDSNMNLGLAPAISLAVGYRRQWLTYFWSSVKFGYQWPMGRAGLTVTSGTTPLSATQQDALNLMRPGQGLFGGFVVGASAGIAFL